MSRPETRLENEVAPRDMIDTVHWCPETVIRHIIHGRSDSLIKQGRWRALQSDMTERRTFPRPMAGTRAASIFWRARYDAVRTAAGRCQPTALGGHTCATSTRRPRICSTPAPFFKVGLRDILADVPGQHLVDEGLISDSASTCFLAELIEHSEIDSDRNQPARLVPNRRAPDRPHGLQLLRG